MNTLYIATILCIGLMIGVEFAVSAFVNPLLKQLDDVAQARATQLFGRKLGTVMPFWYIGSLLLLVCATVARMHQPGFARLLVATILWVVAILMSIFLLVPINNRLVRMPAGAFTPTARQEHRTWDSLHRVRVLILILAMVLFLVGIGV